MQHERSYFKAIFTDWNEFTEQTFVGGWGRGGKGVRLSRYFPLLICRRGTKKKMKSDANITVSFVMVKCIWSPAPYNLVGKAPD